MSRQKFVQATIGVTLLVPFLFGCTPPVTIPAPTVVALTVTPTRIQPTVAVVPTAATRASPTATLVPPTNTPLLPTATRILPTATSAALTNFDGKWEGIGITSEGKVINVFFDVKDFTVTSVVWGYKGQDGKACLVLTFGPIRDMPLPRITQNALSVTLDDGSASLALTGTFNSTTSASGNLRTNWSGGDNCSGSFAASWIANKK